MNTIIRHTEYLLSRYDCVIIPGLGAFLAQYSPSYLNDTADRMMPPVRRISFNAALNDNDGMLASSISRASGASLQKAILTINTEVGNLKRSMMAAGEIAMGNIGRLVYDKINDIISFLPNESFTSVATFWLEPVYAGALVENEPDNSHDTPNVRRGSKIFFEVARVAAVVALIIGAWYIISSPFKFDETLKASLIPELFKGEADNTDTATEAPALETTAVSQQTDSQAAAESVSQTEPIDDYFFVIVGVSATEDESQAFIGMHPGYDLKYRKFGNQYRVYISSHATAEDAAVACAEVRNDFPTAWFCGNY